MSLRELRNPTLALGPRRNILLKCEDLIPKIDLVDLAIYLRLVDLSVLFMRLRRLKWSDDKCRFYDPREYTKIDLQNQYHAVLDVLLSF